jgi:drug/metabolite transporter (DMT)-like permease
MPDSHTNVQRLNRDHPKGLINKMPTAEPHVPQALRGVLLVMLAVLVFACMDATTKHLTMRNSVPVVVAARYVVNLFLVIVVFAPREGWKLVAVNRKGLVWLRAFSLAFASLFAGLALRAMPVAETTTIIYLAPFGVLLLSGPLLGEKVGIAGWLATALGFLGLLLIVRPGSGLSASGIVFALLCASVTVIYHVLSRLLAKTESTAALLFYTALAGAIFFCALLPGNWQRPTLDGLDLLLFPGMGALALLGHFLFTAAYREAPASLLTPVNYMHLAWAALLGWLVFNHIPGGWSLFGIILVAAAGAGNALWNHFSKSPTHIIT